MNQNIYTYEDVAMLDMRDIALHTHKCLFHQPWRPTHRL